MKSSVEVAQIILSIVVIAVVLLQTKGSAFSGAMGGDSGSIYHTRRGLEKTLFQLTIAVAAIFVAVSVVSAAVS